MENPNVNARVGKGAWDGSAESSGGVWNGWLTLHSQQFDKGAEALKEALSESLKLVQSNPSNAYYLGDYQEKLAQYNLFRMLQSNSVKALAETSKNTARNVG